MVLLKNLGKLHPLHTSMHYIKNTLYILLFLIIYTAASAQNNFSGLGETMASVNHNFSKEYSANFAIRSRYFLYKNNLNYKQQQVDFYHFSTFKLNFIHKLSLGIYYRNRDWFNTGSDEWRFTQQFNVTKQKLGVRYGHRIRFEQRLFNTFTAFRQRYRFAVDFPLNGEKLNIGETYLVASTEALVSLSEAHEPLFDQRFTSLIGWQIDQNLKLQSGLEFRWESYNVKAKNNLYLLTAAILKI